MEAAIAGRRRTTARHSAEDQALDQIAKEAEARLAAKRHARAEAREIRMRELERLQKEAEENADRVYDMCSADVNRTMRVTPDSVRTTRLLTNSNNFQSSRRSSEDSLEDAGLSRDLRLELKEFEEKFRKAMIANAQLDNEKSSYSYQVDLLKDKLEELEETVAQLRRELREKNRESEQLKRISQRLKEDLDICHAQLIERDALIQENGLVILDDEESENEDNDIENGPRPRRRVLVSTEAAELLQNAGKGSLDVRLRKFASEKKELQDEIRHLRLELEESRNRIRSEKSPGSVLGKRSLRHVTFYFLSTLWHLLRTTGCLSDSEDVQREANKLLADYKFKLQKAEQDMSTLQATVARLESQVIRYKSAAEASEKAEDELKVEKRKLQREVRETQGRVEELETANSHLQRRLDKLKNAKSALLKEL
ncbi:leucine-rich repeat flightless-interacting protein 2 isoform X3 [Megalopta genalis]|uniref:leucine-rich repeat flightless-interacting protein 2 isoform X3 n=1 Tax=Megalopta genalis TaxID=115081 RepID=UPI00144364B6|nr:leucine-rich repeat flightless-interacting protein 2 isoform X3 [Megalopta genalis]XP_033337976.1 leucine-rich repeat flightless-interacting protein 2 isoform X4 [Megalopta genalis]XP_033337977.1 leucine-rich repeat flightless-interacting protein 2 isoform X3 [Megalopta genalis]XP_033337978.1 leucine-rich repeat flightless-interacting protein 2 isoform X3 [Megalopta genalis]XP_033337979.1 leucine-rich repeat flightless-interacting protein 2 isoform X4 [Megalopta genalis]XP_033337980.1 leuci